MTKRILLIIPPNKIQYLREDRCQSPIGKHGISFGRPPMILAYAAAIFETKGAVCRIVDYPSEGLGWAAFEKDLKDFRPDILFVNTTAETIENDMIACDAAKNTDKNILTISKGGYTFLFDERMLDAFKNLDGVFRGEMDYSLLGLLGDYTATKGLTYRSGGKITRNAQAPFMKDLDRLPFPARHLLKNELYKQPETLRPIATILTGRGCPAVCAFCLTRMTSGGELRNRSPESVLSELEECVEKYKITEFFFFSDTFTWDKEWTIKLCKLIVEKNLKIRWACNSRVNTFDEERAGWMKKAGCYVIAFGTESGDQHVLDMMKKGITLEQSKNAIDICKKYGILSYAYFIIGTPWETKETVEKTIDFAIKLSPDFAEFLKFRLMPGTSFYEEAKKRGWMIEGSIFGEPRLKHPNLTDDDIEKYYKKAVLRFFMRPGYIAKTLIRSKSPKEALNYVLIGFQKINELLLK